MPEFLAVLAGDTASVRLLPAGVPPELTLQQPPTSLRSLAAATGPVRAAPAGTGDCTASCHRREAAPGV